MKAKPILIVVDEKNIRLTMSESLKPLGMPVHTAVNGEEALRKLHEEQASLVFLDLKMPGIDGMEVLRQIKERWPTLRVIIVTAHGTIASAVEAMKLGAVDFLQKPCSPVEIRELVAQFLARGASGNPGQLAGDVEVPSRRVEHRPNQRTSQRGSTWTGLPQPAMSARSIWVGQRLRLHPRTRMARRNEG